MITFNLLLLDNWSLRKNHSVLLVPMLGGIWNLCIDLTEREMRDLRPFKNLKMAPCINYLANEGQRKEETFPGSNNDYLGPHLRESTGGCTMWTLLTLFPIL